MFRILGKQFLNSNLSLPFRWDCVRFNLEAWQNQNIPWGACPKPPSGVLHLRCLEIGAPTSQKSWIRQCSLPIELKIQTQLNNMTLPLKKRTLQPQNLRSTVLLHPHHKKLAVTHLPRRSGSPVCIGTRTGVIGSDVPWLDCPAYNALTWVITLTE